MLEHAETMFDGMPDMMKRLKKASYAANMKQFREKNGHYFDEMTQYVEAAEDKAAAAGQVALAFTGQVDAYFRALGKGKIKSRAQADLNFFMIFYVFPALLLTDHPQAVRIADAVRDAWRSTFKNSNIDYRDYDTMYNAFNEKILGIF